MNKLPIDLFLIALLFLAKIPTGVLTQECSRVVSTSWNDIIVIVEWSIDTAKYTDSIMANVGRVLGQTNITTSPLDDAQDSEAQAYQTRLGVIIYSDVPSVVAPLGKATLDALYNVKSTVSSAFRQGNAGLRKAMQQAMANFRYNPSDMSHSTISLHYTKLHHIGLSDSSRQQFAPSLVIEQFKENGGVIFIHEISESEDIKQLASIGYYSNDGSDPNYDIFNATLWRACCRCPDNIFPFGLLTDGEPYGGCFQPGSITQNYHYSTLACSLVSGHLPIVESAQKAAFLDQLSADFPGIYIGLQRNSTEPNWYWVPSMQPLLASDYQPWDGSVDPMAAFGCVVQTNSVWLPVNCASNHYFVCQSSPCDSSHYCPYS